MLRILGWLQVCKFILFTYLFVLNMEHFTKLHVILTQRCAKLLRSHSSICTAQASRDEFLLQKIWPFIHWEWNTHRKCSWSIDHCWFVVSVDFHGVDNSYRSCFQTAGGTESRAGKRRWVAPIIWYFHHTNTSDANNYKTKGNSKTEQN